MLISSTSALESLGTFKQNECVRIAQVCSDATYINISSISLPNSTNSVINKVMSSSGSGEYYYQFCNTSQLGRYDVRGISDGCEKTFATYFEVTPSGSGDLSSGSGFSLIGSLIVMLFSAGFFWLMSMRLESPLGKIAFLILAIIIFLISILYSMVIVQQNLGEYSSIVSGYETFFYVFMILVGIAFTAFMIFALLVAIRWYKFKRGWID